MHRRPNAGPIYEMGSSLTASGVRIGRPAIGFGSVKAMANEVASKSVLVSPWTLDRANVQEFDLVPLSTEPETQLLFERHRQCWRGVRCHGSGAAIHGCGRRLLGRVIQFDIEETIEPGPIQYRPAA